MTKAAPTSWVLRLPWPAPPLSANMRLHHMAEYKLKRQIRTAAAILARQKNIPAQAHIDVVLTWYPANMRRRDADNPYPTLKAACDGLVDAGLVPDDTPEYMTKRTPVIGPINSADPHLTLTITARPAPRPAPEA